MEVKEISTKNLILGAVLGTALMLIIWGITGVVQNNFERNEGTIDSGITVVVNGQATENTALSDTTFAVTRGDKVELIIPYDEKYDGGNTIMILIYLSGVEAYLGDEQLYSYGMDQVSRGDMVGSGYHFIALPEDLEGQDIHIDIYVNEKDAFTSIDHMSYAPSDDSYHFFASKNFIVLFIGIFLAMLGIITFIAGSLAAFFNKEFVRLPLIGAFSCFMGVWSFMGQKTFQLFVKDYEVGTMCEYIFLYLAPVPLLWMVYVMRKHMNDWKSHVLHYDAMLYTLFVTGCFVLHALNILHIPRTLISFHIVGATMLVISVVVGVFMNRNKTRDEEIFQLAIFGLCGAIALELMRFNMQKYIWPNSLILKNSFLPIATLVFIMTLILSYLVHLYDLMLTRTEKEMLTQLAYHDELTGLYNRAKANERFEELASGKDDYCFISLDANGLKYINDTYGHEAGDKMLKGFGRNLHEAFRGVGKCYRMGGDEFLVIVRKKNMNMVNASLKKLEKLQNSDSDNEGVKFDASYGVAYSKENPGDAPEKTYSVADDRMYEMKMKSHNSRAAREQVALKKSASESADTADTADRDNQNAES